MAIALIEPPKGMAPVAMRFGEEIITLKNLEECTRKDKDPLSQAKFLAAIECELITEAYLLLQCTWLAKNDLDGWRASESVIKNLNRARGTIVLESSIPQTVQSLSAPPKTSKAIAIETERTYVVGKWKLCIGPNRNTLHYGPRGAELAPSVTRALAMLFCNPGYSVTNRALHYALRHKVPEDNDKTVDTVFRDLRKIMKTLGGDDDPIEILLNGYRLNIPKKQSAGG